ncbi:MAG: alpha/beta fold hydrolase [bacterium]
MKIYDHENHQPQLLKQDRIMGVNAMWGTILTILIGGVIGGDAAYNAIVKHRLNQWESHVSRDANGIRQGCQEFTTGNGDIALLMVHGFGDSPALYTRFAPALAEMGFTCKAMRLPGFAEPMTEYAKTSLNLWLEALDKEVNQLGQQHSKVWIVAHSLGGAIAIRYLMEDTIKQSSSANCKQTLNGVDGVILLAPFLGVSSRRSPLFPARTWHKIGNRCLFITKIFENYLPIDAHDPDAKKSHEAYCDRFIPRNIYSELFKLLDSLKEKSGEFNLPMLMMLSIDDEVIEPKSAEQFYQESSSTARGATSARGAPSRKRLIVLENSGHVIPLDYEWKEAVSAISAFIYENNDDVIGR